MTPARIVNGTAQLAKADAQLIKAACGHPVRLRIIAAMASTDLDLSPLELAKELHHNIGDTSYHVRILRDNQLIHQTRTVPRRGAVQHYYRPNPSAIADLRTALANCLDQLALLPE